jgi:cyclin A
MPVRTRRSSRGGTTSLNHDGDLTSDVLVVAGKTEVVDLSSQAQAQAVGGSKKRKKRGNNRSALGSVDANNVGDTAADRVSKRRRSSRGSSSSSSSSNDAPAAPAAAKAAPAPAPRSKTKNSRSKRSKKRPASKKSRKSSPSSSSSSSSTTTSASKKKKAAEALVALKANVLRAMNRLNARRSGINHGQTIPEIIKEVGTLSRRKAKLTVAHVKKTCVALVAESSLFVNPNNNNLFFRNSNDLVIHNDVTDIDIDHARDPRYATSYVTDIMSFRRGLEISSTPGTTFLDTFQADITPNMRSILVDWLVEVAEEYHLHTESLFTAVNYVDRCLERSQIHRHKLQLLGCACMLLASKFEEIYAPAVDEFVYISDNTYTHEEIVRMESKVCKILNFKMTVSTTTSFLTRYTQASKADETLANDTTGTEENKEKATFFAKYVTELALQEYNMLKYKPSMIAAAAVSLSRRTCHVSPVWHKTLTHYTKYEHDELRQCERSLRRLQRQASGSELRAIYEKYSASAFQRVSTVSFCQKVLLSYGLGCLQIKLIVFFTLVFTASTVQWIVVYDLESWGTVEQQNFFFSLSKKK